MKSRLYFGTDGVRGPYGGELINEDFAARLAEAAARWVSAQGMTGGRVLIGRDTRESGPALLAAIAGGLKAAGFIPVSLGVCPTPAVARAVKNAGAPLGVVITASHNPASDNGIKFFGTGGMKLTDEQELAIEGLLPERGAAAAVHVSEESALDAYRAAALALLPARALAGWKIVLDTAHGATCATSPAVLRALGAEVIGLGDQPTGKNINEGTGSEHPAGMAALVKSRGAQLGIAHDGDGDRCVLCDEQGAVLDGDELLTVLGHHALVTGTLKQNTLVITVQSNLGVDAAIRAAGGRVCRTPVGDRYVIERMRAEGATLGGESSGHIVCSDLSPTGDGLIAALKIIEVMVATGKPLSVLRQLLKKFPQGTRALVVKEKIPVERCRLLPAEIALLEAELGADGRVLVRYSGTEPKLRLLVEGPSQTRVDAALDRLEKAARTDLAVA